MSRSSSFGRRGFGAGVREKAARETGLFVRNGQDLEPGTKPDFDNSLRIAGFCHVSAGWRMDRTDNPQAHR